MTAAEDRIEARKCVDIARKALAQGDLAKAQRFADKAFARHRCEEVRQLTPVCIRRLAPLAPLLPVASHTVMYVWGEHRFGMCAQQHVDALADHVMLGPVWPGRGCGGAPCRVQGGDRLLCSRAQRDTCVYVCARADGAAADRGAPRCQRRCSGRVAESSERASPPPESTPRATSPSRGTVHGVQQPAGGDGHLGAAPSAHAPPRRSAPASASRGPRE